MSHVPVIIAPENASAAEWQRQGGECPAPLNNQNPCAKGRKTPTESHWPSEWGLGDGPITDRASISTWGERSDSWMDWDCVTVHFSYEIFHFDPFEKILCRLSKNFVSHLYSGRLPFHVYLVLKLSHTSHIAFPGFWLVLWIILFHLLAYNAQISTYISALLFSAAQSNLQEN